MEGDLEAGRGQKRAGVLCVCGRCWDWGEVVGWELVVVVVVQLVWVGGGGQAAPGAGELPIRQPGAARCFPAGVLRRQLWLMPRPAFSLGRATEPGSTDHGRCPLRR